MKSSLRHPTSCAFMASAFLIALVLVLGTYTIVSSYAIESFRQSDAHMFAHFGGTPNNSQVWPAMVKYPKQYV